MLASTSFYTSNLTPVEAVDFHHYSPLFILLLGGENDKGRWKLPILVVWWCTSRYMWIVVNSVCQREKALVGICSPKQTKPLASNCRCACARQLWRSRRGSRKARQFCLFAGTANLVVIVTTGMQVCRKQTGTRRIFLPH